MLDERGASRPVPEMATMFVPQPDDLDVSSAPSPGNVGIAIIAPMLRELQSQRRFCIKSQSRCDRSIEAFIARLFGYSPDLSEEDTKALWARVRSFRKKVERDGGGHSVASHLTAAVPMILLSAQARQTWDGHRNKTEAQMRSMAKSLSIWTWVDGINGFGALGLAIIIGEAGDLSNYATIEKLWRRLGLAVIDGVRQQKTKGKEGAALHGYNPVRRAEIWALADSFFKHQWRGDKDIDGKDPKKSKLPTIIPAHAISDYGSIYQRRKERTKITHADWEGGHRDADARRIMTKALLENLWKEWRRIAGTSALPDPEQSHGA